MSNFEIDRFRKCQIPEISDFLNIRILVCQNFEFVSISNHFKFKSRVKNLLPKLFVTCHGNRCI